MSANTTISSPPALFSRQSPHVRRLRSGLLFLAPIFGLFVIWHIAVTLMNTPSYLLPTPGQVAKTFWALLVSGTLIEYLLASVGRLLLGCIGGFVVAVLLGYAIGMSRVMDRIFSPIISVFQPIPGIAWIPLAILWFGLGPGSVAFIIFLSAFFPILMNTVTGVRTIGNDYLRASKVFMFPQRMMLLDIILPGALPYIVTGTRIGFGYGWRALVAGEMIAASSGLGYMIFDARSYMKTDEVIVGMLTIGLFWAAVERFALRPVEQRTVERWGMAKAGA